MKRAKTNKNFQNKRALKFGFITLALLLLCMFFPARGFCGGHDDFSLVNEDHNKYDFSLANKYEVTKTRATTDNVNKAIDNFSLNPRTNDYTKNFSNPQPQYSTPSFGNQTHNAIKNFSIAQPYHNTTYNANQFDNARMNFSIAQPVQPQYRPNPVTPTRSLTITPTNSNFTPVYTPGYTEPRLRGPNISDFSENIPTYNINDNENKTVISPTKITKINLEGASAIVMGYYNEGRVIGHTTRKEGKKVIDYYFLKDPDGTPGGYIEEQGVTDR